MVSLKAIGVAYVAANLLGVDAGLCRPSSRTSLSQSASIVSTTASGSTSIPTTSTDHTSSTDETTATDSATSGTATESSTETLISSTTEGSTLSTIVTPGSSTVSVDLTISGSSATSSDAVTSVDSTVSTETSTSIESTTSGNPTTTAENSVSTNTSASTEPTTTVESSTTADTTTASSEPTTTTSSGPTTTTSACVEPTNLLRQPGFEPSDSGTVWGFYWGGGSIQNDPSQARTGDGFANLPVPENEERRMEQRIHIVPDTEYTISFYYSVVNPPADTQCFVFATFDYYTTLKQVSLPSDTEYHKYTASFISSDNLDPAIEIGVSCPGAGITVNIDDASVLGVNECDPTPVDPNAPPRSTLLVPAQPEEPNCPVNLVQVPGFEPVDGEQAWAFYNRGEFVDDASNARTGEWEALLPSGTRSDAIYLEQNIAAGDLVAGEIYDYHFFWKPKTLPDSGQCYMYGGYNDQIAFTWASINFGATSSTGYTLYSARFNMPSGDLLLQIVFFCDYNNGNTQLGSVYVDDTALIKVGGCEAYPVTGALIENPSFEIQATDDSTYAWFGNNGMTIKAGSTNDGPSPNSGNNFLYVQLSSSKASATLTKPLASALTAGQTYNLQFSWSAGSAYSSGTCSFTIVFGSVSQTLELNGQITAYQYQQFQYSFVPAEAVESMSVTVSCTSGFPDFVFDDFSLQ
ncbi:hypothetical protein FBEOM_3708 [Fusarium beomiforme]|uniref:CBM-cenC domain-containing protein n=1 Tax=Fusarium beomiforme TaxID=44412 RepID=A0A9P5APF1_9HYPO|nr:hypothetical protein FBEOM_3708 [Fusarium beomiforme]